MWWMMQMAWASPGSAGALHFGALPLDAGTQWAGIGGAAAWTLTSNPPDAIGAPHLEVGTAIGDRAAASFQVATTLPRFRESGFASTPFLLSGRYLVVDQPNVRFAVVVQYLGLINENREFQTTGDPFIRTNFESHLSPGIALDTGGESVRFDLAVPLWGLSSFNQFVGVERLPYVPLINTLGVSFRLSDTQRLRIGLPETISWHLRTERFYADVGGFPLVAIGAAWAKFGLQF